MTNEKSTTEINAADTKTNTAKKTTAKKTTAKKTTAKKTTAKKSTAKKIAKAAATHTLYAGKKIVAIAKNHEARPGTKRAKALDILLKSKTTDEAIPKLKRVGANNTFIAFAVRNKFVKLAA